MSDMTDELKPVRCGCGGEAEINSLVTKGYYIKCSKCGIMQTVGKYSEAEAITAWNRAMGKPIDFDRDKERKKGKWLWKLADNGWVDHICSECGWTKNTDIHVKLSYNFCPNCGAEMTR